MAPLINMCGISGNINKANGAELAIKMASIIKHRGPDEGPVVVSKDNVNMAAVRLSIIDVAHGTQPMYDESNNIISQNGEIYNYRELRDDLALKGHTFKTDCDTEVLLKGFKQYGPNFVEKLDGIFAIAFYNHSEKSLYLFRDHFGVKPLYFYTHTDSLEYSSEIKSFWYDSQKFDINQDYLIYNQVFNWSDPEATLYKGILPVPPSCYLKFSSDSKLTKVAYTPKGFNVTADTYTDKVDTTKCGLEAAVESQIPNEVGWGVLLSGGVDSSILAWIANNKNIKINTFSVASSESETEDLINAREIAKILNSKHEEIRIDSSDAVKNYADYLYSIEDINSRFFFYYFIARHLQGKIKVALCGEGSDELYMGYPVYKETDKFIADVKTRWGSLKNVSGEIKTKIEETINELENKKEDALYRIMIKDQLPWFQLNPVDKCSMRFGVELRVPYLSLKHAAPVMSYSKEHIKEGEMEKMILRNAFKHTKLPTILRKKFFAGTRTLPTFYKVLDEIAQAKNDELCKQYPTESTILNIKDLYALSLLDVGMRSMKSESKVSAQVINLNI